MVEVAEHRQLGCVHVIAQGEVTDLRLAVRAHRLLEAVLLADLKCHLFQLALVTELLLAHVAARKQVLGLLA